MPSDSIQKIAEELYAYLADRFPVCSWSDEFVFFPQAISSNLDWTRWDDFSPDSVEDAVLSLRGFRNELGKAARDSDGQGPGDPINAALLLWVTETLEEQLEFVRHPAVQPTFILTVATMGLVQALQSQNADALLARMETLPDFLDRFRKALIRIPELFREAGIQMAHDFGRWLDSFRIICDPQTVVEAKERLVEALNAVPVASDFRLSEDLLERIVQHHTGSGLDIRDCLLELEEEIAETLVVLESEAGNMGHGRNWESAFAGIGRESIPEGDKVLLLRKEIRRLRDHCFSEGLPWTDPSMEQSIVIEKLPASLKPVRAADSYSAVPGFPFRGGIFYIFDDGGLGQAAHWIHPVYRMTAAHEVYPGHHLLDMCRWNGPDPLRRPVEYPLFHEGWACFGEDMMLDTGAFDRDYDRLILARRRHRHAVRGKVDLLLHRGDLDLNAAARELESAGFSRARARETAGKYALRPAYQMCYTIGRRRFQRIFQSCGGKGRGSFVQTVLGQGEILFGDLERVLKEGGGKTGFDD